MWSLWSRNKPATVFAHPNDSSNRILRWHFSSDEVPHDEEQYIFIPTFEGSVGSTGGDHFGSFTRSQAVLSASNNSAGRTGFSSKGHIEGNSTLERNVAKLPRPSVPEPSHVPVLEATSSEGETVRLDDISKRMMRAMRDTNMAIHYFTTVGSKPIRYPPQIPRHYGIEVGDLFMFRMPKATDVWHCTSIEPRVVWHALPVSTRRKFSDGQTRVFVITSTGLPGWVASETIRRKYKPQLQMRQRSPSKETQSEESTGDDEETDEMTTTSARSAGLKGKRRAS